MMVAEKDMMKNMDKKMKEEMDKVMNEKMGGKKSMPVDMNKMKKEKGK